MKNQTSYKVICWSNDETQVKLEGVGYVAVYDGEYAIVNGSIFVVGATVAYPI